MYGRKRVYAGPPRSTGFKRTKYTKRGRRRSYGRRRNFRRNGGGRDAVMTTNGLRGGGLRFNSRRGSYSTYKKRLWDDGMTQMHYRSVFTVITTLGTPINRANAAWNIYRMHTTDFHAVAGGAQPPITGTTDFNKQVTIRGGKAVLTGINNSTDSGLPDDVPVQLFVRVFVLRTILGGSIPGFQVVNKNWDPTIIPGLKKDFKIYKQWTFTINPGESFNVEHRLGIRNYDINNSPNQYVWNWGVLVSNLRTDVSEPLDVHYGHSISFSGDVTVE